MPLAGAFAGRHLLHIYVATTYVLARANMDMEIGGTEETRPPTHESGEGILGLNLGF